MKNITQKLIKVQSELKAPKGQKNTFGNYNYRSAEDILEAVKPLLSEQGLLMTITDIIEQIGERYYIQAKVILTDGEDTVEVTGYARESLNKKGMDDSQITGTASSYARKYAMNGLFLIDDTKDSDSNENRTERENRAKKADVEAEREKQAKIAKLNAQYERALKAANDNEAPMELLTKWNKLPKAAALKEIAEWINENTEKK
ncbi:MULTISPECIES: ERF family protein [Lactococcus]|uniref:ERF family protein n=1 Tax=Lactococcus TaxID=1357 RepID=UPI00068DED0A|nr:MULTISPECIES: ERF family protein [Lactococcus]KZK50661.1 Essential recombination function protein [Lactococcus cremoris]MDM7650998.1 ERF family protein [Lactococcus lactis]MDM7655016.1 ERF family protein [Lactococcus cremoris]WBM78442.1 ERF family protein [Lactococcus lactis]WSP32891.1 ERF family protein [Lactococcus lactis subsp. lactis]